MNDSVNLHIYPAPIVNESRIFRQTKAAAETGLFERVVVLGQRAGGLPDTERLDGNRSIERVGAAVDARPRSLIGRVREQISWSVAAYRAWKKRAVRVVNAHSVAVLPVSYAIARRHKAALIYDTHELETETSTSGGLQGKVFRMIERRYIRRCAAVFVVNESIAAWYRSAYPGVRVTSVRNAPSRMSHPTPVDLRHLFGIPAESRIYVHVGNVVAHRHVPEILEAFVARESSGDHVVFIGGGTLADLVRTAASTHVNIHHLEAVAPDAVVDTVAGGDVGLCMIEATCLSYALSLPNKALEYSMAGIPFFYTDLVEVDHLLGSEGGDWKIEGSSDALVGAMASMDDDRLAEGRAAIEHVDLPTWPVESARMIDEYRRVLGAV
ncbi:glycosyltransferase [Microbacterium sp. K24]|uniref:glycosyltransferase n=1 Tax=Microbacterium sp. K24 TaxID=2305446 RepID=UPI00109C3745|nr:glycosyltransferase [Microbacterium sp. K24]